MKSFIIIIISLLIVSALVFWAIKQREANSAAILEIENIEAKKAGSPNYIRTRPAGPNVLKDKNENLEQWKAAREKLGKCEKVRFISFDSAYCAD